MEHKTVYKIDMEKSRFGEKGAIRNWISKLSKGLMLPIALLPIAGLFLGVGAGWINILINMGLNAQDNAAMFLFPTILQVTGDVIFGSLPALFAVSVAIAFTDDAGTAGLSALVAWLVFNMTQNLFILPNIAIDVQGKEFIESFNILWYTDVTTSVVGANLGIRSMTTSVFGGIIVGLVVAGIYNKFKTTQLPAVVGFFSGTRLVLIMSFFSGIVMSFAALLLWPQLGIWLNELGSVLSGMPVQTNALVFGVVERALIPFGLHHAFYAPLWYSSAGGTMLMETAPGVWTAIAEGDQNIWFAFGLGKSNLNSAYTWSTISFSDWRTTSDVIASVPGLPQGNWVTFTNGTENFALPYGYVPGTYMQGKYAFMIFGLPAAGAAMVMLAKKENRQVAFSIIGAAALTAMLTGITEPIEFTFLFLAPFLYYGFHIWMAGISFWAMSLVSATVGMTFSGGLFDLALYGLLPNLSGQATTLWWYVAVFGGAMVPVYFFVFYWYIKRFNIATPGREEASSVKLYTKADYAAQKVKGHAPQQENKQRLHDFVKALGGLDNMVMVDACITRLRLQVADDKKVNDAALRKLGAAGVVHQGKSVQVILGAEADLLKHEIKALKKEKNLARA